MAKKFEKCFEKFWEIRNNNYICIRKRKQNANKNTKNLKIANIMKANVTLNLTAKELEVISRAVIKYANEQMKKSATLGNQDLDFEDAAEIRAMLAVDVQCKIIKKQNAHPELKGISLV